MMMKIIYMKKRSQQPVEEIEVDNGILTLNLALKVTILYLLSSLVIFN